jgi:hypothetical protein
MGEVKMDCVKAEGLLLSAAFIGVRESYGDLSF